MLLAFSKITALGPFKLPAAVLTLATAALLCARLIALAVRALGAQRATGS